MKILLGFFGAACVAVLSATGCSSLNNSADSRGAGLNDPSVARNESSGTIAGSPDPAPR